MIEVRLPYAKFENEIHMGMWLLKELRFNNVPVVGSLWPIGCTEGSLTLVRDDIFEEVIVTWAP